MPRLLTIQNCGCHIIVMQYVWSPLTLSNLLCELFLFFIVVFNDCSCAFSHCEPEIWWIKWNCTSQCSIRHCEISAPTHIPWSHFFFCSAGILHKVNNAAVVVLTRTFRNTSNASWFSFTVNSHFLSLNQQAQYVSWINAFYFKQAYSEKCFVVQSLSHSSQHAMCYE